jgi:tetratricopeptide (TPR) repeat protein
MAKKSSKSTHKTSKTSSQTLTLQQAIQLANQYYKANQLVEAETLCRKILQTDSQNSVALYLLGLIADKMGQTEAAINLLKQAILINPTVIAFQGNLGNLLKKQGKLAEAFQCYQQVLYLDPHSIEAYNNLGNIFKAQGQLELAITYFQRAIALKPDWPTAHLGYSLALLKKGEFILGWQEYEWRLKNNEVSTPKLKQPRWDGTPLAGQTLLIHWEQGLGDTIQFSRYLTLLTGGKLIFVIPSVLASLLKNLPQVNTIITHDQLDKEPDISYDIWIPLLSLPRHFATTLDNIPAAVPYLYPDLFKVEQWHQRFAQNHFKIGIVWAGNPNHQDDRNRSCSLTYFAKLAELPHVTLFSLQKGAAANQPVPQEMNLVSLTPFLKDFSDTAAVIANLDLIISVDTAIAHLAGAIGQPVWVLLHFNSDWRWLVAREDTPWYPTMRLFRQPTPGDWDSVFSQVLAELTL